MNRLLCSLIVGLLALVGRVCHGAEIKEPAVAGAFYTADRQQLSSSVDRYLAGAGPVRDEGRLLAVVAPHAGHVFSGPVAGHAYARLKGKKIRPGVLLGPSHHVAF